MNLLLTDVFRRRVIQAVILVFFLVIALPSIILLAALLAQLRGALDGWAAATADLFMRVLSSPVDSALSQAIALIATVFPAVLAIVCFGVDRAPDGKPVPSTRLNGLGKAILVWLIIGAIASASAIVWFTANPEFVALLARDPKVTAAARAVISGIFAFQLIYIVKLLGLENVS